MTEYSQKTITIKLDEDCTIYEVSDIHEKLTEAFRTSPDIKLDCSKVKNIDSSFIQLLLVAKIEAKRIESELGIMGDIEHINEFSKKMHCDLSADDFKKVMTGGE